MAPLPLCFSQCVSISRYPISCLSYRPLFNISVLHLEDLDPKNFYAPANRCYREGQRGPCKANQTLYEGQIPGHGICDCAPKLGLIYSSYDDECYIQNVQGPCRQGNWWVLDDNGVPMCQPVPRGCPADGRHVFWRISIGEERRCYRLGQRGPCTAPQTVTREIEDGSLDVSCAYSEENQFGLISRHLGTTPYIGCPRGSRRSIRGYCRPVW